MTFNHTKIPPGQIYIHESNLESYIDLLEDDVKNVDMFWLPRTLRQVILHHYAKSNQRLADVLAQTKILVEKSKVSEPSS